MKNSLRVSSFLVGFASVSLTAACSGLTSNEAIRAANAQRNADGKPVSVALKITDFPNAFEESGCSTQAEVHATILEPDREPLTVKSSLKRGGSLQLARAPAKGSRLRLEIRLTQEKRTIFQAEGPLAAATSDTLNVTLAQDSSGADSFKIAAPSASAPAETALSIWQGQAPSTAVLASTVMLTYGAGKAACSGTLVCGPDGKFDPNKAWVLTAAHCMTPSFASFGPEGYTSTRKCTATGTTAVHPEMRTVPSATSEIMVHDIALVQFQCPASALAGVTCAKLNSESLAIGESLTVAGYGKLSTALAPGKLMQTTIKVAAESARDAASSPFAEFLVGTSGGMIVSQASGTGVCSGDSGGPSYVIRNNVTYVAGVHSSASCDMTPNFSILLDVGVAAHKDWITRTMGGGAAGAAAAPTTPGQDPSDPDAMAPSGAPATAAGAPSTQKPSTADKKLSTPGDSSSPFLPTSQSQTCPAPTVITKQGANDK